MPDLSQLENETLAAIDAANDEAALETVRVGALGKKGSISALLATLGKMSPDERKTEGAKINALKDRVGEALSARKNVLKEAALAARLASETLDVTLPVRASALETGRIHPISQVMDELTAIFADMGFSIAEGPDVESDDYNFTKLNFPPGHPAREMHDTFFFNRKEDGSRKLLRTHTSPVQVRTMLSQNPPPIRVICPGRTYRMQFRPDPHAEIPPGRGPCHRQQAHIGHLKWILRRILQGFLRGRYINMRFRPCSFRSRSLRSRSTSSAARKGGEIRFGEGEDWLEILGCGMVHPNVLRDCGIDPDVYQGFAWGMGIDRIAMLKYGMPDFRAFFEGDVRWLQHYGFRPLDLPTLAGGLSS